MFRNVLSLDNKNSVETLEELHKTLLRCVLNRNDGLDNNDNDSIADRNKTKGRRFIFFARQKYQSRAIVENNGEEFGGKRKSTRKRQQNLASGFRDFVAPTSSFDYESDSDSVSSTLSLSTLDLEKILVETIRDIGEIIVKADQGLLWSPTNLRSDPCFEYFCDCDALALLVDIAKESPNDSLSLQHFKDPALHGIVWSPTIKAQILRTISFILASVRDTSALHYFLSRNLLNELILSFLPLSKWTDQAFNIILFPYVDLLNILTLQLNASFNFFPFLTMLTQESQTMFPLFTATLATARYSYNQSHSFAHATCLTLIVNLLQIDLVRSWFVSVTEGESLSEHICQLFLDQYVRFVSLSIGPVVNTTRSTAIANQITGLVDLIDVLNDIFSCQISELNVCLCELFLQRLVSSLLRDLLPLAGRQFLSVGEFDADVIPEAEARAQVAIFFISSLFEYLEYAPLLKMLLVAVIYPKSTAIWTTKCVPEGFFFTSILNSIVQESTTDDEIIPNPYREEIIGVLRGNYGEWRLAPLVMLLEYILKSEQLSFSILEKVGILSGPYNGHEYFATSFELEVANFLVRQHELKTSTTIMSLERISSFAIQFFYKISLRLIKQGSATTSLTSILLTESPVFTAFKKAKYYFYQDVMTSQLMFDESAVFLDLIEEAIKALYKPVTSSSGTLIGYSLSLCHQHLTKFTKCELFIRKNRAERKNILQVYSQKITMALLCRAVCCVLQRFVDNFEKVQNKGGKLKLISDDVADEQICLLGALPKRLDCEIKVDLTTKVTFRCSMSSCTEFNLDKSSCSSKNKGELFSTSLLAVFDSTCMMIVEADTNDKKKVTMICSIPFNKIIAAAVDEEWLHVAVRHDDVDCLIKNGNLALLFDNNGTCLAMKQTLERYRKTRRQELLESARLLFQIETN